MVLYVNCADTENLERAGKTMDVDSEFGSSSIRTDSAGMFVS